MGIIGPYKIVTIYSPRRGSLYFVHEVDPLPHRNPVVNPQNGQLQMIGLIWSDFSVFFCLFSFRSHGAYTIIPRC